MRSLRSLLLAAAVLSLPFPLAGQLQPLSEVFPVWWPVFEPSNPYDPYLGPATFSPGSPVVMASRHGFAVATLGSNSNHDTFVAGKLLDLSGEVGPGFLGSFLENWMDPVLADPALASVGSGGFVLAWASQSFAISFRKFGAGGTPRYEQEASSKRGYYCAPAVAGNASGGFAIAWESHGCYGHGGVSVRAFQASGLATAEIAIPVPESPDVSAMPRVGIDATGRFVVLWRQRGPASAAVRLCGQSYGARGGFLGSPFCIGDLAGTSGGALAVDPAGAFLAAWFGPAAAGAPAPLFVRRYHLNGTPLGEPKQVGAATDPSELTASADGKGNAALSWRDGDRLRVLLVRRDAVARGPAITISGVESGPGIEAGGVALTDSGRLLVAWRSEGVILGRLWRARF